MLNNSIKNISKSKNKILNFAIKNSTVLIILKLIIAVGLLWYLVDNLDYNQIIISLENANYYLISVVVVFMFLNLYLQFLRWELTSSLLLGQNNRKKIFQSFIYGISAGAFTPARLGEYLGRAMVYKDKPLLHSFGATFLDKFFLLIMVLFFGSIGSILFVSKYYRVSGLITIPLFVLIVLLFMFFILTIRKPSYWYVIVKNKIKILQKLYAKIDAIRKIDFDKIRYINKMAGLSFLHFLTILLQFALLVSAFSFMNNYIDFIWAGALILFVKSVIPSVSLGDLGIRETAAVFFLLPFGVENAAAFNASIFLFFINILLPALFGLFFLVKRNDN